MHTIRKATFNDIVSITNIYNQAVIAKHQTASLSLKSLDNMKQWFLNHDIDNYPIYLIELQNQIIGYCSLSPYRKGREAFQQVSEISYYFHKDYQKKGFGSILIQFVLQEAKKYNFNTLIAILLSQNIASIKLLEKFKFKKWGTLPKTAMFDNILYDHLYYGLKL